LDRFRLAWIFVRRVQGGAGVIVYCAELEAPALRARAPVADLKLVIRNSGETMFVSSGRPRREPDVSQDLLGDAPRTSTMTVTPSELLLNAGARCFNT
jgi:hypothetical protein